MKIKNFFMLIKASILSRKLSNGLFCFFIFVSTVLILLSVEILCPLQNNVENKINNHVFNRELSVSFSANTSQNDINEMTQKIKQTDNVTGVYLQPATLTAKENSGLLLGEFTLDFLHCGYKPVIVSGRQFDETETNVALVPEVIKDLDNEKSKINKIEGKDLIGKTLELSYGTEKTYNVKVVGTYSTADPIFDGKQIIVPQNDLLKCNDDAINGDNKGDAQITDDICYLVSVNSYKNVDQVQKDISSIRSAEKQQLADFDADTYNFALILLFVVLAIFVVMVICGLFMFLKSNIKSRTTELALYRSLGYKSKHLFSIIFSEHLVLGAISIVVGIIVTILLNSIFVNQFIYSLVGNTLMAMTVNVNILDVLTIVVAFGIVLTLVCIRAVKQSEKTDLTILLREN